MTALYGEDGFQFAEVNVPLEAKTCEDILRFLLDQLVRRRQLSLENSKLIYDQVMRREVLGSTAIGRGLAIPHTKTDLVKVILGIIGTCAEPVIWPGSLDEQKVETVCLLITPQSLPGDGLRALEYVARRFRQ
jgi:nitrogen PTS system EIIA component